jgi:hypothetical protein
MMSFVSGFQKNDFGGHIRGKLVGVNSRHRTKNTQKNGNLDTLLAVDKERGTDFHCPQIRLNIDLGLEGEGKSLLYWRTSGPCEGVDLNRRDFKENLEGRVAEISY